MTETEHIQRCETALCIWSHMLGTPSSSPTLRATWGARSSEEMRQTAINLANTALSAWHAMTHDEQQSCTPYDCGFISTFVGCVEWKSNSTPIATVAHETPRALATAILAEMRKSERSEQPVYTLARLGDWLDDLTRKGLAPETTALTASVAKAAD